MVRTCFGKTEALNSQVTSIIRELFLYFKRMQKKLSKKIMKVSVGFVISAILTFLVLLLGNVQSPYVFGTKQAAESFEYIFYDYFFKTSTGKITDVQLDDKVTVATNYDPNILIVDIDEPSLQKLGNYNTWDRNIHAKVVDHLSRGGASAIAFDILFKNADFGEQKTAQSIKMLKKIHPESDWNSIYPEIKANYNYDSVLVKAVHDGGHTITCFEFAEAKTYKHESMWRPLSVKERADELGYHSTMDLSQADHPEFLESKDLLDNIFPELAHAGVFMGSVNAYPDDDGIERRVSLLYRFPNTELDSVNMDVEPKIYTTISLLTVLHLYHQELKNVKIKLGEYIDVGKPFGVYRDEFGDLRTTFPHFTYPMFAELRKKLNKYQITQKEKFIDVSSKIIATRHSDSTITFEIFDGQILTERLSQALFQINESVFDNLIADEVREILDGITIERDPDNEGRFILKDTEEDEEATINAFTATTVQYFKDRLQTLEFEKPAHLALDMDIRYDIPTKQWKSNLVILSNDVIEDIKNMPNDAVERLKKGEEIRFGNVKRIPIDAHGRYLVNYQSRYNTSEASRAFQHISYYDVLGDRIDEAFYQGKTFILGSAAPALFDFLSGPHEEHYPGVLVHATILQNILNNKFIVFLKEHYQQIIVIILAFICTLLGLFARSYVSITIAIIMMTLYTVFSYYIFLKGVYIGVSKQLLCILLTTISSVIVQFYYESKEKRFLGNAFKQYISPELIDAMVTNEIMPTLGGEKSNITAYFTDIASFSTFSEKIGDPSKLVELLNEYLTAMTDTLLMNKGTLDKYEGDAIIAFFGAPMPLVNHAQSACESAVDMQNKLMELRKKWKSEGDKWPTVVHDMHMRIGINSGDIVTGNMGSTMRKNYTMMGDAVNLAARLESAAKQYGAYIQISEDTQAHLEEGRFIYRTLDTIRVIGKSQPVKTYELLQKNGCENESALKTLVVIWEQARKAYLAMNWDKAKELFTICLDYEPHHPDRDPGSKTTPSHVYIKRCEAYKQKPPVNEGEVWDGVFTATEK